VQSSKLVIIADEGLFPRIKALNLPADIVITGDGVRERSWEIMDLNAMEHEPLSPGLLSVSPEIISAPAQYNAKGYTGDFSTWKGMGLWVESLYEGRDTLDFKYTCKLGAEVDAEPDTLRKIKMIYRYMQKTCRFVGVEIGIGGWQPVTANDVAHFGYGDCKGLANYTKALLKTFGIRSFCVLVQAGRNPVTIAEDFPSNGFNHVILAVPLNKDTVWLECTDMSQPFGYLGSFTDDRFVLLLAADGGIPARTPMYPKGVNTLRTHIDIVIDTSGNAEVVRKSTYKGLQYESVEEFLSMNAEHLKEKAKEIYNMPGLTLTSIQVASAGDFIPEAYETLKVSVKNYASLTGNRIFIPLNPFLDEPGLLNKDPERKNELVLRMPYIDYDTLVLHVPAGFTVESLPQSCNIKNQFGHMESELKAEGSTLKFYRKLEMEKGTYPAAAFNDFVAFLQQINRQDKAKVVLKH